MLGYFGPAGTFTHQALRTVTDAPAQPFGSVQAVLDAVRAGEIEAGLVPIENSVEGGVTATLDNLASGDPLYQALSVLLLVYLYSIYESSDHIIGQFEELLMVRRELDFAASHDPLTGLLNRRGLDRVLDEAGESGEALDHLVAHVVVHEVGHHFGLSDAAMHALEDAVA